MIRCTRCGVVLVAVSDDFANVDDGTTPCEAQTTYDEHGDPTFGHHEPAVLLGLTLINQIIETLEQVGCQFDFCNGPTTEVENMITCHRCLTLALVRVAAGRPARRADEVTFDQRDQERIDRIRQEAGLDKT